MRVAILFFCAQLFQVTLSAQFKTASMEIDGLTCSMCSYGVQKSIQKLSFIKSVNVDLNTNIATIEFRADLPVSIKELIKSVSNAGYSVRSLKSNFFFQKPLTDDYLIYDNSTFIFLNPQNDQNLRGLKEIKFVEKSFSEPGVYKKYKKVIENKLSSQTLKDWNYFVLI